MLREQFIGRNPSHFHTNPIVKAFIVSETFIWSAWNFFVPIFGIFAANDISGGNIQIAASSYSAHLITRVIFELISCKILIKSSDNRKFLLTIGGFLLLTISYVGLSFSTQIIHLYIMFIMSGIGIGLASPAKNSLFSTHLDKNKEATEWGIYDAAVFTGTAMAATIGGFIAEQYGFQLLFILAAVVNLLGIIPYLLYMHRNNPK